MELTLTNPLLEEFGREYLYFGLPSFYYFNPPLVMLNSNIIPNRNRNAIEIDETEVIKNTFQRYDEKTLTTKLKTPEGEEDLSLRELFDMGYADSKNIIFPETLKWGEILSWCKRWSDMSQTNLFPVGVNSKENIIAFLKKYKS